MLLGCSRGVKLAQVNSEHSCGMTEASLRALQERLKTRGPQHAMKPSIIDEGTVRDNALSIYRKYLCAGTGTGSVSMGLGKAHGVFSLGERHTYIRVFTC